MELLVCCIFNFFFSFLTSSFLRFSSLNRALIDCKSVPVTKLIDFSSSSFELPPVLLSLSTNSYVSSPSTDALTLPGDSVIVCKVCSSFILSRCSS